MARRDAAWRKTATKTEAQMTRDAMDNAAYSGLAYEPTISGLRQQRDDLKELVRELRAALNAAVGPLRYAYRNGSSPTADKVKAEILPSIEAALAKLVEGETK